MNGNTEEELEPLRAATAETRLGSHQVMTQLPWSDYQNAIFRPDWSSWSEVFHSRRTKQTRLAGLSAETHRSIRQSMLDACVAYTRQVGEIASRCLDAPNSVTGGLQLKANACSLPSADMPIVMTGHQPIVFHPGIEIKYAATALLAKQVNATSLAVIMDTDPGSPGDFLLPIRESEEESPRVGAPSVPNLRVEVRSLATTAGLYSGSVVLSSGELTALTSDVDLCLRNLGRYEAADNARRALLNYSRLPGVVTMQAHSAIQRNAGRFRVQWEIPFSTLMTLPGVQQILWALVNDASVLTRCYNDQLDRWRTERGIKNPANPFPSLARQDGLQELPFWIVDSSVGTRRPLWITTDEVSRRLLADGETVAVLGARVPTEENYPWCLETAESIMKPVTGKIVPRGALVSMIFRMLCCDVFVHGTGGGTYDQFTDELIRSYFHQDPPDFRVASGTRYLFDDWRIAVAEFDEWAEKKRDVIHHPENYFGRNWFPEKAETQLHQLLEQKEDAIGQLRLQRQAGQSAAESGRRLEQISIEIKALVEASLAPKLLEHTRISDGTRQVLKERTFPWFYFNTF